MRALGVLWFSVLLVVLVHVSGMARNGRSLAGAGLLIIVIYLVALPAYVLASLGTILPAMLFVRRSWNLIPVVSALLVAAAVGGLCTIGLVSWSAETELTTSARFYQFLTWWALISMPWFFAGWTTLLMWPFEKEQKSKAGSTYISPPKPNL